MRKQRKEILEAGIVGYNRRLRWQGGTRHRKGASNAKERAKKKVLGKTTWFKYKEKKDKNTNIQNPTIQKNTSQKHTSQKHTKRDKN